MLFWADPDRYPLPQDVQPYIEAKYDKIRRCKKSWTLYSRQELKKYKVTYDKRVLIPNTFDTVPLTRTMELKYLI